ncbi:hypothetical protein L3V77_00445 [Vibrio sp. DW001]|uniref:hypothetical protein n=1 Tax=Vibrio sp. DW001 TaxID=2912315 RepID=UPI0023AEE50D|nr:hypothetical protein [Vibrio sp. DW001]WED26773.1 hypothetical protein L3V77_00445 [Vibrio sp. DW001]
MNTTILTNHTMTATSSLNRLLSSAANEVLFFTKMSVVLAVITLLLASAWV